MGHLAYAVKPDDSFVQLMVSDRKELEIAAHTDEVTRHTRAEPGLRLGGQYGSLPRWHQLPCANLHNHR